MTIYKLFYSLEKLGVLDVLTEVDILNAGKCASYERYCYYLKLRSTTLETKKYYLVVDVSNHFDVAVKTIYHDIHIMEKEIIVL